MTFIDAVLAIEKVGLQLCEDPTERNGSHHSICVYRKGGQFIGKLRWPDGTFGEEGHKKASVDDEVEEEIMRLRLSGYKRSQSC